MKVNHQAHGRKNVSNIGGGGGGEFLILEPLDRRKRPFQEYLQKKIFNQRKNI